VGVGACGHAGRAAMQGVLLPVREREREKEWDACARNSLSPSLFLPHWSERERERKKESKRENFLKE
jgi:hypothetical protein